MRGKFDDRCENVLNRIHKKACPGLLGWLISTVGVNLLLSNQLADAAVDWLADEIKRKGLLSD